MKIGILTFHCAHNYGAVLQCYTLQEILKSMGHEVEIIDYRPLYLTKLYKIFSIDRFMHRNLLEMLKKSIKEILMIYKRVKRFKSFQYFIQNRLNLSNNTYTESVFFMYDVYIIGSDQIWNPKITKGFDSVFWADFKFPKNNKIYMSYAASMEISSLDIDEKNFCTNALTNFDYISVRESSLAKLLQELTDKKIETVLDPTLLANSSTWNSILKPPFLQKKYVLIYQVRRDINVQRIASQIAKQINAEVIEIRAALNWTNHKYVYQCCSPEEFLGWIKYASCVVTTSFHGTAFSLIFNKSFYCLKLGKGDMRISSLLKSIHLENRLINKNDNPIFQKINYELPKELLAGLREKSYHFLYSALNSKP